MRLVVLIESGRSLYQGPTREFLDSVGTSLVVEPQRRQDASTLRKVLAGLGHDAEPNGRQFVLPLNGADVAHVAASV
ncbi:MAG: hypothetical protein QOF21_1002, partial [Actinomycetota bacterium]